MTFLFQYTWNDASNMIKEEPQSASGLFYDWFCSNKALLRKATNMLPKINFVFDKLGLDPNNFKVTLKNNCPVYGELYDSFIIDSMDDTLRIYISPRLGFKSEELNHKCELSVLTYNQEPFSVEHKLSLTFDNWQKFKNNINNGKLKQQILQALNIN